MHEYRQNSHIFKSDSVQSQFIKSLLIPHLFTSKLVSWSLTYLRLSNCLGLHLV